MNDKPKTSGKKKETREPEERRLLRAPTGDDRLIGGVAAGLARFIGTDPVWVRLAFAVSAFAGGLGLFAYIVMWVVVPEDDGHGRPLGDPASRRAIRALIIVVVAAAALTLCAALAVGAAWLTATGHGAIVASTVIGIGVVIAATAFFPDARRFGAPLLGLALALALPAGAVAAADIEIDGGIGERTYTPTTVADIPVDGYELGVGHLVVDLRDLPWAKGQTVVASSTLGVGQMIVSVPSNVCVHAHATGKAGELLVRGDQSDGLDPEVSQGQPRSDAPRLDLRADIQFGQMIVTDQDPDHVAGPDYDHNRLSAESQRQTCGL